MTKIRSKREGEHNYKSYRNKNNYKRIVKTAMCHILDSFDARKENN
jgi:hypothetical protein